jgi:hypothetical protein
MSEIHEIDLSELIPDPKNARSHPDENKKAIESSLQRFGAARSIVIDKDGVVRAGSGTLEAASKAGISKVRVIESDGTEIVAVMRSDWSEEECVGYGIADNRTAELAVWEIENLKDLICDLEDVSISDIGFTEESLSVVLKDVDYSQKNQEIDASGFEDIMKMSFDFSPEQYYAVKEKLELFGEDPALALIKALDV